jgi:hypothetical protein
LLRRIHRYRALLKSLFLRLCLRRSLLFGDDLLAVYGHRVAHLLESSTSTRWWNGLTLLNVPHVLYAIDAQRDALTLVGDNNRYSDPASFSVSATVIDESRYIQRNHKLAA